MNPHTPKEMIRQKFGFINGLSLSSNPDEILKNFDAAMEEYAALSYKGMRWVQAVVKLPEFENAPEDFGVVFRNKKQVKTFTVYPSYTRNIPALLQNELEGWEWLDESVDNKAAEGLNQPKEDALDVVREIAWTAWKGAANAFRLYPDNKHTFADYWDTAKEQLYSLFKQQTS